MSDHDDAKAMAKELRTLAGWNDVDDADSKMCIRAADFVEQQSSRITDLETQVRGDADRLQRAVDTEVELRTRIGELEAALEEHRQHALERCERS